MSQLEGFPEIPPSEPIRLAPNLRAIKGGADKPAPKSLMTNAQVRAVEYAASQELAENDDTDIGYGARLWASVALPYRDPGNAQDSWDRRNGNVAIELRPALILNPETGLKEKAYPYGLIPRQLLLFLSSEAMRTGQPQIELGSSMREFLIKLGMNTGGRETRNLQNQIRRLFGSSLKVEGLTQFADGRRNEQSAQFSIVGTQNLWFGSNDILEGLDPTDPVGGRLFSSTVTLSEAYYKSIQESPIPVDLNAIRALGKSPMRQDIYLWATYRVYDLRKAQQIRWSTLNEQFGSNFTELRQFRASFLKNLQVVNSVFPSLRFDSNEETLTLHPSRTHISPTKPRRKTTQAIAAAE